MIDEIFLGVYWHSRQQNLRESVNILLKFLILLKNYKRNFFANLYSAGWSKKEVLSKKIEFNYDSVKNYLFDRRQKEDNYCITGFNTKIWNGKDDFEGMTLSSTLGYGGDLYPNSFTINLPSSGEVYEYYKDKNKQ